MAPCARPGTAYRRDSWRVRIQRRRCRKPSATRDCSLTVSESSTGAEPSPSSAEISESSDDDSIARHRSPLADPKIAAVIWLVALIVLASIAAKLPARANQIDFS